MDCTFRVKGKTPELWNPETGEMHDCPVYRSVDGGTEVPVSLQPQGSVFVVFRKKAEGDNIVSVKLGDKRLFPLSAGKSETEDVPVNILTFKDKKDVLLSSKEGSYTIQTAKGKSEKVNLEKVPDPIEITGSWEIRFPYGWGAPVSKTFPKLISWTDDPDDGIKYFSGIATYYKEFDFNGDLIKGGNRVYLDLGKVRLISDVYLNGKQIGILWKNPFTADVTEALKPGKNLLIVEVANTWSNRLTGDGKLPESKRFTHTNIKHLGGPLKKGPLWKDVPLLESGLLGPVRLTFENKVELHIDLQVENE